MKLRPIVIDSNLRELSEHGTESFPMSLDEQRAADVGINSILHWHDVIQISYVTKGCLMFKNDRLEARIDEGQAIFFNSTCLHEAVLIPKWPDSVYVSLNFHPDLIYGYLNSSIYHDYVYPVLNSHDLDFVPLTESSGWHREICELISEMITIEENHDYGYEICQKNIVNQIWRLLVINNKQIIDSTRLTSFENRLKIRKLENFINTNYVEPLTLEEIANSLHISRGECCRIFKRVLNITPFQYLVRYRITQSLKYLTSTDLCISDIAQHVGFGSSSYFTECFKREMQLTPLKYRQNLLQPVVQLMDQTNTE